MQFEVSKKCFISRHLNCSCLNNVYIYCLHLLAILTQAAQLQADMVAIHRNLKELAAVQVKEADNAYAIAFCFLHFYV